MARRSAPKAPGAQPDRSVGGSTHQRAQRAAEANAVLERQRRREVLRQVLIGVVTVAVIAAIFTVLVLRGNGSTSGQSVNAGQLPAAGSSPYGVTIGKRSAPHTVIIYEDFICPYCGEVEAASHEGLASAAAAGKAYVEYRPFNLLQTAWSAQSLNAFAAIKTISGPTVAKQFHDLVYAHQPEEPGPSDARDQLVSLADQVVPASQQDQVDAAIRDEASQKAWTDGATAEATRAGITSTPTVLLDGKLFEKGSTATELGQQLVEAVQ